MFDILKIYWTLLRTDRRGVTAVEYAVIAGVMVAAIGVAFGSLGTTLKAYFAALTF
ncbi:MAG TPA: Flp family type IVb pilin [Acetobacteraceae bacterium]|nr:Flp family type IVb pilin [Acetobacteraceae bacterium]